MTAADIITILRGHERIVYLPKSARKNPLTQGVIKDSYAAIAEEILSSLKTQHNAPNTSSTPRA